MNQFETKYPSRVTQGEDGVYRWSYNYDLRKTRGILHSLIMRGRKVMGFEMDDRAVALIKAPARWGRGDARSGISFEEVREIKELPRHEMFNLVGGKGAFQIWVPSDDYEFVREYMLGRIKA